MRRDADSKRSLEQAVSAYQANRPLVSTYLASRAIPAEAADYFRLGYVTEPQPGHERVVGRLAIPYLTRAGVVALRFRCTQQHNCKEAECPKYLSMQNAAPHIYNVEALFSPLPYVGIAEGELDAICLSLSGIPAVGVAGTHAWLPHFARPFAGYAQVFIFTDADDGGRALADQLTHALTNATVITLPPGRDVNDVYATEGPESLRKRAGL